MARNKSMGLQWQDFDKLLVINRLRKLVGSWWSIQLNFTDEKGFVRGVPEGKFFNPINQVCKSITKESKGFKGCMGTVKKTTIEAKTASKPKLSRCHAGFSTLSVPIIVDSLYLGCVFGDGFIVAETEKEQRLALKNHLENNYQNKEAIVKQIDELPVLSEKEVSYLGELIKMVVDEMVLTQSDLYEAKTEVAHLKTQLGERYEFAQMVGKSSLMQDLYQLLEKVCDSSALVLVQGSNGTGKELIARALHYNSKRKKNKFLVVNCGAFNENLLESELFGHLKGSFTGAGKDKIGLFEAANGGTLFLDEIGETSPSMQVKLLRVLQQQTFTPVGSTETKKSTARVVCATNRDLAQMVKDGTFREDLFYRLNVINVLVPDLKDRREDVPLLIDHFLEKYSSTTKSEKKILTKDCQKIMLNYDWPGNIRELENEIERLCVLAGEDQSLEDIYLSQRVKSGTKVLSANYNVNGKLKEAVEALEREMILEGLKRTRWNKSKLAKELGISRAGLIMKVDKYDLDKRTLD